MSFFDFCFTLLTKKSEKIAVGHKWSQSFFELGFLPSNFMVRIFWANFHVFFAFFTKISNMDIFQNSDQITIF